ncbi:MAG: cation diffusion facilitator family transporter [Desulfotomaculaceae bacterium]|nr:cation diffusion facilitator family transporter [Desulfotomaculaceae bacterium]
MVQPTSCQVAFISVVLNLIITLTKGVFAYLSGSSALLAEIVHGASDLVASLAIFIGIRVSRLKGNEFPFVLYKVENFVALISATIIFFGGYEIARESFLGGGFGELKHLPVVAGGLLLIVAANFVFSNYEYQKGRQLNSPALIADAYHLRVDIASNLVVLVGLLGAWLGYSFFDRLAALIVVVFVLRSGWHILVDAMKSLLDASVDIGMVEKIYQVVNNEHRVHNIKSIVARNSGSVVFISLDLILSQRRLKEAHNVSEQIVVALRTFIPHVEEVHIHY